jgi:hypothetical protein
MSIEPRRRRIFTPLAADHLLAAAPPRVSVPTLREPYDVINQITLSLCEKSAI